MIPARPSLRQRPLALAVIATTAICCALLILPGATVTSAYFNDLLIFLDGGYRVVSGQVPNRDFHTALGPLAFYIPGVGYWLTRELGLAMPVGMSVLIVLIAPVMTHVLGSRLRPVLAVPTAIFLLLLLATPMNVGETIANISFAMYYNRIGWAMLGLLLVMHLRPARPANRQGLLDAASAAILTLVLAYTKMTYGVVAVAFLLLTLLQPAQRAWSAAALVICAVAAVAVEMVWGGTRMHIADLALASQVSGVTQAATYLRSFLSTSGEYVLFAAIAATALWRAPRMTDLLFYGFCICAGLALVNQNFQIEGIVTLLAGAVVAAERLARHRRPGLSPAADLTTRAGPLVAVFLLLPIGLSSGAALGLHTILAASGAGIPLDTPAGRDLRVAQTLDKGQFKFFRDYAESLESGAELLASLDTPPTQVLVFDFVSPFSALAGLEPPDGGTAWMHDGRNFDGEHYFSAEEVLGDVNLVMIPKRPIAGSTTELMEELYGDHLDRHFRLIRDTTLWRVLERRPPRSDPQVSSRSGGEPGPSPLTTFVAGRGQKTAGPQHSPNGA
ncbi:MAG: hypothetical protein AAF390_15710 [Pseudomonadota bacterium]